MPTFMNVRLIGSGRCEMRSVKASGSMQAKQNPAQESWPNSLSQLTQRGLSSFCIGRPPLAVFVEGGEAGVVASGVDTDEPSHALPLPRGGSGAPDSRTTVSVQYVVPQCLHVCFGGTVTMTLSLASWPRFLQTSYSAQRS